MSEESIFFEKQISRIHKLLEDKNATIKWNDRVSDPDNPSQERQIDISIVKDNQKTFIECRLHKAKQNVKWIEELIGRKLSLRVDNIIAVSSSGFTKGAIKKAREFDILLRDMRNLTDTEIKSWSYQSKIKATFYNYSNISVYYVFSSPPDKDYLTRFKNEFNLFLNNILDEINLHLNNNFTSAFTLFIIPTNWQINKKKIDFVIVKGNVKRIKKNWSIPVVKVYDSPEIPNIDRPVKVETTKNQEMEIIKTNNDVSQIIDISAITVDKNQQFSGIYTVDFGKKFKVNSFDVIRGNKITVNIDVHEKLCTTKTTNFLLRLPILEIIEDKTCIVDLSEEDKIHYRVITDLPYIYSKILISKKIKSLNDKIARNTENKDNLLIDLCFWLINNHDFSEAIKILQELNQKNNSLEARILLKVLADFDPNVIMNLHSFSFRFFMSWKQEPLDSNDINVNALIDGINYKLNEYRKNGIVLPVLALKTIGIKNNEKKNKAKFYYNTVFLKLGLVKREKEVYPKYSEVIAKLNIELNKNKNMIINKEEEFMTHQ